MKKRWKKLSAILCTAVILGTAGAGASGVYAEDLVLDAGESYMEEFAEDANSEVLSGSEETSSEEENAFNDVSEVVQESEIGETAEIREEVEIEETAEVREESEDPAEEVSIHEEELLDSEEILSSDDPEQVGDTSGYFGPLNENNEFTDSVFWHYEDHVLTISGTGEMADLFYVECPWYAQSNVIETVIIEEGITDICRYFLYDMDHVRELVIPSTVETLGNGWYFYTESLESIIVAEDNPYFCSVDNAIYTKDGTELIYCAPGLTGTYTIPDGVETIAEGAFDDTQLSTVILPDSIRELTSDSFPEDVTLIQNDRVVTYEDILYVALPLEAGIYHYDEAYEILNMVNLERAAVGLDALVMDEELLEAAMLRASEQVLLFSHTRPNGESCFSVSDKAWGENIAIAWSSASAMYNWMNSTGHRENILGSRYESIGVGAFELYGTKFYVQLFGVYSEGSFPNPGDREGVPWIYVSREDFDSWEFGITGEELTEDPLTMQLYAYVSDGDETVYLDPSSTIWFSGDDSIGTISEDGILTATGNGTLDLYATIPGADTYAYNEVEFSGIPPAGSVAMHRLFSPFNGEHLYTSDVIERDYVTAILQWIYEGVSWYAPIEGEIAIVRLYNPDPDYTEHHYTADMNEVQYLTAHGWIDEGVKWYSDPAEGVPVYRLFNPDPNEASAASHHYTTDVNERDVLVTRGWIYEGISWYGMAG